MHSDAQIRLNRAMMRLAEGDRSASSEVFFLLWPELSRFARRALESEADAEDAAQVALEKVFFRVGDYDDERPALAWALAITSWECRSLLTRRRRHEQRISSIETAEAVLSRDQDPEEAALQSRMMLALHESFENLPRVDREVLETAFLSHSQTPQLPALRKRKERALARLRQMLKELL